MGLIDRLRRVTVGRIEAFLDQVERPEDALSQIIAEMTRRLDQLANAEAKSLTALKGARRREDEINGRLARLREAAELAMRAEKEDLTRQVIAAQIEAEAALEPARRAVEAASRAYDDARTVRERFLRDLTSLKARKAELLARASAVRAERAAQEAGSSAATRDLLDAVSRMEDRIAAEEDALDAQASVEDLIRSAVLEDIPTDGLRNAEVQRRLDELRRQAGR